jgi:Fanconi anemia group M protein
VVLPTGLGRTVIALLVMAKILYRQVGKCLFQALTKPLVDQHESFIRDLVIGRKIVRKTGDRDPEARKQD